MKRFVAFLIILIIAVKAEAVTSYDQVSFEIGQGTYLIEATGLNDFGTVVGSRYLTGLGSMASRWDQTGRLVESFTGISGEISSRALSVNNKGQILLISTDSDRVEYLVLRNPDGSTVNFGAGISDAYLNDRGQVIGTWWEENRKMFFWDPAQGYTYLGSGVTGGINNQGQIIGMSTEQDSWKQTFIWSANTEKQMIGNHAAYDINDQGMIVGINEYWTSTSGWQQIILPYGLSSAYLSNVNNSGVVVGSYFKLNGWTGFVWSKSAGFSELSSSNGTLASNAYRINSWGQIIGRVDGKPCLWTPVPEPSSIVALATGLVGIVIAKRRKK